MPIRLSDIPEQPSGPIRLSDVPEPTDSSEELDLETSDRVTNALKHFGVSLASGSLKGSSGALNAIRGLSNLTGRLLGQDVESPEWKNAKRITDYASQFDELAKKLDKYNEETGASPVTRIPGQVLGQLPAGILQWEGNIPLAAAQGFEEAKAAGQGTGSALVSAGKAGIERGILGKALHVLGNVKNAAIRRGGSAGVLAGDTALHGGTLEDILTQGAVGAVVANKPRRGEIIKPPETPGAEVKPTEPVVPEITQRPEQPVPVTKQPITENPEQQVIIPKTEEFPIQETGGKQETYKGPAYRSETGSERRPEAKTAADVIRYEQDELGNTDIVVTPEKLKELEQRPATDIVWVTRDKLEAARYGTERENIDEKPSAKDIEGVSDYTKDVAGGEIIADIGEDGVLVLKPSQAPPQKPPTTPPVATGTPEPPPEPEKPKVVGMRKSQALKLGHDIPNMLGWTDAQRMDFMKSITGKTSMKDMDLKEMRLVVEGMQAEAKRLGFDLSKPTKDTGPITELVNTLKQTPLKPEPTEAAKMSRGKLWNTWEWVKNKVWRYREGQQKPEYLLEQLDGGKKEGIWSRVFNKPLRDGDLQARELTDQDHLEFIKKFQEHVGDGSGFMLKQKPVPGTKLKLTDNDRVGIAILSLDKNGLRHLTGREMGFTEADLSAIRNSLSPGEKALVEYVSKEYPDRNWPAVVNAANQSGFDPAALKKLERYLRLSVKGEDPDLAPDIVTEIAGKIGNANVNEPGQSIIKERTGSTAPIETGLVQLFWRESAMINRFTQLAPLANHYSKLMANNELRRELNIRTKGLGTKIITAYLRDGVRGNVARELDDAGKLFEHFRKNGVKYAMVDNVLSYMRQRLGRFNEYAEMGPAILPYRVANMVRYAGPGGLRRLEKFVYTRSLQMKFRSPERDIQIRGDLKAFAKALKGKRMDERGFRLIRNADEMSALHAWKDYYDFELKNTGNEADAIKFADYETRLTQSSAYPVDMPPIYRGGEVSRMFTTFMTESATQWNYWGKRVYGAYWRGEIGAGKLVGRAAMSHIIPALMMGMISRGFNVPTWKQALLDVGMYAVNPFLFFGNVIQSALSGIKTQFIAMASGEGLAKVISQLVKAGKWSEMTDAEKSTAIRSAIKGTAQAVGGATGKIPAQHIRLAEGAYDLATGQTQDPRRLIWSKSALERGQKPEDSASKLGR